MSHKRGQQEILIIIGVRTRKLMCHHAGQEPGVSHSLLKFTGAAITDLGVTEVFNPPQYSGIASPAARAVQRAGVWCGHSNVRMRSDE